MISSDPHESRWRASEVLPALALVFDELSPFLKAWDEERSLTGVLQLAEFLEVHWVELRGSAVEAWVIDPARGQALEAAFEAVRRMRR